MSTAEPTEPTTEPTAPELVTVGAALAELTALGSVDAIADRLRELNIRAWYHSQDCPIHDYLALRTGIPGNGIWVSTTEVTIDPRDADSTLPLPELVREFITAHDNFDYPELTPRSNR